eukprot:4040991-Karenia_brevis.AAC.1
MRASWMLFDVANDVSLKCLPCPCQLHRVKPCELVGCSSTLQAAFLLGVCRALALQMVPFLGWIPECQEKCTDTVIK